MYEKIKVLISLQNCDMRIKEIQRKKGDVPIRIDKLKDGLALVKNRMEEESDKLDALKNEARNIEHEIEDLEGRIEKSKIKLSNIKSNKEYHSALKEIDDLNARKTLLEDRALEIMENIDKAEAGYAATRRELDEVAETFKKKREEILQEAEALEYELNDLEQERTGLCQSVDDELLRRYNHLKENRGDIAVSPVIRGVCQVCHLGIPPQKFNELIKGDQLMVCPNCMRIIYWGEDDRFQTGMDGPD